MTNAIIQSTINNVKPNETVLLPKGEFEGPFVINTSCTIVGSSTTLYADRGPVLTVNAENVRLRELRVELTGSSEKPEGDEATAIIARASGCAADNVEVLGEVRGIHGQSLGWSIPRQLGAGAFPSNTACSFLIDIEAGSDGEIDCAMKDLAISPKSFTKGINRIRITTERLRDGAFLYGEIVFRSDIVRRMLFSGKSEASASDYTADKLLFSAVPSNYAESDDVPAPPVIIPVITPAAPIVQGAPAAQTQGGTFVIPPHPGRATVKLTPPPTFSAPPPPRPPIIPQGRPIITPVSAPSDVISAMKGQRIAIDDACKELTITLDFGGSIDVDPYVFVLGADGRVVNDSSLVFFNNTSFAGVVNLGSGTEKPVKIKLDRLAGLGVERAAICYSIYGDNPSCNFSKVLSPVIYISSGDTDLIRFKLEGLFMETTVLGIELYKYKSSWKINMVGSGYNSGMRRLCQQYGVNVID